MNDTILKFRLPTSVAERLKSTATEFGRTPSDVVREGAILNLRRLESLVNSAANFNDEPPQAA